MQILIEIPESEIPKQQDIIEIPLHFIDGKVCEAGNYGFEVLPKGHGRLIDADAFIAMMEDTTERQRYKELLIDDCLTVDDVIDAIIESLKNEGLAEGDAPTIIPAGSEDPT